MRALLTPGALALPWLSATRGYRRRQWPRSCANRAFEGAPAQTGFPGAWGARDGAHVHKRGFPVHCCAPASNRPGGTHGIAVL